MYSSISSVSYSLSKGKRIQGKQKRTQDRALGNAKEFQMNLVLYLNLITNVLNPFVLLKFPLL